MNTALICLEQLDIGGVETFAITQIEEFKRRGIKCIVLARDGILSKNIKNKRNIKYIEFNFELKNNIDFNKNKEIEKIIEKYKIDFIYIHQFSCIPYILPATFKYKIPYVAYLHNIIPGTLDWFMDHYSIYKSLFPLFFNNASKIITIAKKVKEEHQSIFHIDDNKYKVINNSLDFSKYPDKKVKKNNKELTKLLLFGRISELKRQSIYTAVDFYNYCKKINKNTSLTVVGDGEIFDEIKEKYKDTDIVFKGAVADMKPEINKADILLGVDRCMLEAVASKKPAVVCGYNNNVVFITPKKIKKMVEENFGGYSFKDDKAELFKYTKDDLTKIIEENYQYVKKRLSITNCVYLDIDKFPNEFDISTYFNELNEKVKLKELNELIKEENYYITDELNKIVNSRRWKMLYRILNFPNGKKRDSKKVK